MDIVKRSYMIISKEGLVPFIRKGTSHVVKKILTNSTYRFLLPEYINLNINGKDAKFHTSAASLEYDFRDDFDSERQIISNFITDLEEDDIVYDVGANVGLYSSFSGNILNDGKGKKGEEFSFTLVVR